MKSEDRPRADSPGPDDASLPAEEQRALSAAAQRALAEAEARRVERTASPQSAERGGRGGLEPVRYGDWEVKGLASDF